MSRTKKQPPPDTPGNVMGRIGQCRSLIKAMAATLVKEGMNRPAARRKATRAFQADLDALEKRLKTVENGKPAPAKAQKKPKPSKPQKPSGEEPEGFEDFLDFAMSGRR